MRLPLAFDARYRFVDRVLGVTPSSSWVDVTDDVFEARLGPWRVRTPRDNVSGVTVTGPYSLPRTIGPAHISLKDRGLTFATNPERGACVSFVEPVAGIDPFGLVRHPALTVTVAEPELLTEALRSEDVEREVRDEVQTMTARELRDLADELGVAHTSTMRKTELVALLKDRLETNDAG